MPEYPTSKEEIFTLWLKIADNFYTRAISLGLSGLTPPSWNDDLVDLQRKVCYYTARLSS